MLYNKNKLRIHWSNGSKSKILVLHSKDKEEGLWWCTNVDGKGLFCINPLSSAIASIEKVED